MATKPTRLQQQAAEYLAESLFLISEAFRLDGRGALAANDFRALAQTISRVSSQSSFDEIVAGALKRRAKHLALKSSTADLITLMDGDARPLETLLLADASFIELVRQLEDELGEI